MTKYNTLNVKLSNSQLNKLKSTIKDGTEIILTLSSNLIGGSNDETNFPYKLTDTQVSKICKTFANGSSVNIKFSKTQLSRMIQSGGFSVYDIVDLIKMFNKTINDISLNDIIKTVNTSKFIIGALKSVFRDSSGAGIALTNNETKDIIKVIKSFENKGILLKRTTKKLLVKKEDF